MDLAYGRGAYSRTRGGLPELPVINMFVEASRSESRQVVMQSRRGLVEDVTVGSGPIRATMQKDGVFGGDLFVVSDDELYRDGVSLGTIDGTGPVFIEGRDGEVLVCAGASLWSYNGTDLVDVTFPDSAPVVWTGFLVGYFLAIRGDTGILYFSALNDGRTWDGLDALDAEQTPDRLTDALVVNGALVLFGEESIEFWSPTGDPDAPFAPISLRTLEQGIFSTGCAIKVDNSFFWVGRDRIPYRNGEVPEAIGDDGIVERLKTTATMRVFLLEDERHKFVCVRGDTFTVAYDVTTGEWCEFQSYGLANFRCGPGMGDDTNGTVWRFEGYLDNGGVLERRLRAGVQLPGPAYFNKIRLTSEVGATSYLTGDYADPIVEMRTSDDAGKTWSVWEPESLGEQGEYRTRVEWRALGMFDDPGMLAEFRVTDPVSWRLSAVEVNAQTGGRSR